MVERLNCPDAKAAPYRSSFGSAFRIACRNVGTEGCGTEGPGANWATDFARNRPARELRRIGAVQAIGVVGTVLVNNTGILAGILSAIGVGALRLRL